MERAEGEDSLVTAGRALFRNKDKVETEDAAGRADGGTRDNEEHRVDIEIK